MKSLKFDKFSSVDKLLIIFIFSSLIYSYFSLYFFKIYYRDSLWIASFAYNFAKEGYLLDVLSREPGLAIGHGRIMDLLYGNFMLYFTNLIYAHRFLSWIISFPVLILFYLILRNINFERTICLLAVLFLSVSEHFLLSSHSARPEILVLLTGFMSLFLFTSKNQTILKIISSGLLISISIDIHLSSQIFIFILIFYELSKDEKFFRKSNFHKLMFFLTGYFIGLLIVIFNNINHYQEIKNSLEFANAVISTSLIDRFSWIFLFGFDSTLYRWLHFPIFLLIGVYYFLEKRILENSKFRSSFWMFLGGLTGYILLGRMNHHYLIIFFPFLYAFLISISYKKGKTILKLSLIALFSYSIFFQLYNAVNFYSSDLRGFYDKASQEIELTQDVTIVGPDNFWFIFKENDFYSYQARVNFKEILRDKKVIFISNELYHLFKNEGIELGLNTGVSNIPDTFLDDFKLSSSFEDYYYGSFGLKKKNTIRVYKNF